MKHGNALRRGLALVLSAAMAVSTAFAADGAISGSKRSSQLDENNTATIELSLPADQEQLETDVVFVLDKSTSAIVESQILEMLNNLNTQVTATGAKVNVGVVIFNKKANSVLQLTELNSENMPEIETAIKTEISSGTNTHAGLLAGKAMLDADTGVDANRKYMIFVSDGITYIYNEDPTAIGLENGDKTNIFAGPENWQTKYGNNNPPGDGDWDTWLDDIEQLINADADKNFDYPYGTDFNGTDNNYIAYDDRTSHAMSIDKALYLTHQVYQEMTDEGYHCYAMTATSNAEHPWAVSFMNYLANGQDVDFTEIQNDIWYLVNDGSTITDTMGEGEIDGHSYNFVIKSINSLKINDTELKPKEPSESENGTYTFVTDDGEVHSIITVAEGKKSFDWEIKQPITNFARVKLTYTVELQGDILGQEGTFGVYNEYGDGSENNDGLFTNASAILTTQDGRKFVFSRPTVSYGETVIDPGPEPTPDPDPGDGDDEEPYDGPELTIVKVDEEGETITSPATFHIYKEQGDKVLWRMSGGRWSEDEEDAWSYTTRDGETTCYDLKPGTYYIVEISAPEGYDLAEEPLEVEVESRDVTVEFVNSGDGVVTTPTKPVPDTGR